MSSSNSANQSTVKPELRGPVRTINNKKPASFATGPAKGAGNHHEEEEDDEDDDDFKKGNLDYEKMFMDQLIDGVSAANGAGYDDGDMLEEDDEMRDPNELCEEDLLIDEED